MCSLVSAEPSARGCGRREIRPSGVTRQRFLFDALAALLQYVLLATVDEPGQVPLELTVDGAAIQASVPLIAKAPRFTT